MKKISFIGLSLIAGLCGCATAYQPLGFSGGYSETQLGPNIFQVGFRGNGYTSDERASNYALLRAAEVTLANGFKYFIVADSKEGSSLSTYTTPTQSYTTGSAYGYGGYAQGSANTTTYGGDTYVISKPRTRNTIVCFEEKPDVKGLVFEAAFLIRSLKKQYEIGEYEAPSAIPTCKAGERLENGTCRAATPY